MHSHSPSHAHSHAPAAPKPPRPNSLVNFILEKVHDTELWANYLPSTPIGLYLLALMGLAGVIVGGVMLWTGQAAWGVAAVGLGVLLILPPVLMALFVRWKRGVSFNQRNRMLDSIQWRGDEQVLDVGCGNGLILNGAAQRLTTGKAVGIDLWVEHGGGGSYALLQKNARLEKVTDRITFRQADARQMPFEDGSFDVVMSSGAIHHMIRSREEFEAVMREMLRVLKPGGMMVISDITHLVEASAARMKDAGLTCEVTAIEPFLHYERAMVVGRS